MKPCEVVGEDFRENKTFRVRSQACQPELLVVILMVPICFGGKMKLGLITCFEGADLGWINRRSLCLTERNEK